MAAVRNILRGLAVSVAGSALLMLPSAPVFAGFEWTPPPAQAAPAPETAPAGAVPQAQATGPLTPEPDDALELSIPGPAAAVPVTPVDNASLQPQPAPRGRTSKNCSGSRPGCSSRDASGAEVASRPRSDGPCGSRSSDARTDRGGRACHAACRSCRCRRPRSGSEREHYLDRETRRA